MFIQTEQCSTIVRVMCGGGEHRQMKKKRSPKKILKNVKNVKKRDKNIKKKRL